MVEKSLEEKIQYIRDYNEIMDLAVNMYRYNPGEDVWGAVMERFALKTPGVRSEMCWGVYEKVEGLGRLYPGFHQHGTDDVKPEEQPGFIELCDFSPILEIAEDGKTAKLLFYMLGFETWSYKGKMSPFWTIGKRGFDFVKEDGRWKIWHYHVYGVYFAPYTTGWIKGDDHMEYPSVTKYPPDRPSTTYDDTWYKPNRVYKDQPVPPAPYETFDDKTAY